jgi:hypothetical protein
MTQKLKRILIDIAGYLLILLGVASGWLPGPGGIPLILAGLGLLSIHNQWARRLRDYLISHGAEFLKKIFPENRAVQIAYDLLAVLLLAAVTFLTWRHAAIWQISLAIALFCLALVIAAMNRGRGTRLKHKLRS